DGIRDDLVTGVQTCALPISAGGLGRVAEERRVRVTGVQPVRLAVDAHQHLVRLLLVPLQRALGAVDLDPQVVFAAVRNLRRGDEIGRASCRDTVWTAVVEEG